MWGHGNAGVVPVGFGFSIRVCLFKIGFILGKKWFNIGFAIGRFGFSLVVLALHFCTFGCILVAYARQHYQTLGGCARAGAAAAAAAVAVACFAGVRVCGGVRFDCGIISAGIT